MNFFSFMGWPDCAKQGCPNPGLVKVELEGPAGPLWAHLCVLCMAEIRSCMATLSEVQNEAENRIGQKDESSPAGYLEQAP